VCWDNRLFTDTTIDTRYTFVSLFGCRCSNRIGYSRVEWSNCAEQLCGQCHIHLHTSTQEWYGEQIYLPLKSSSDMDPIQLLWALGNGVNRPVARPWTRWVHYLPVWSRIRACVYILHNTVLHTIFVHNVCIIIKCTFVSTTESNFNYTMHTKHLTRTYISEMICFVLGRVNRSKMWEP
jgi:hypothetical protein